MAGALKSQIDLGRVELTELRGRMTVKLKDKILFSSGSAKVGREGQEALAAVAGVLKGIDGKVIRVEGHTDNVPVGGAFPTNWELSTARALAVVRFLQAQGLDPARLAAAGYGEYRPIAPNDSAEGRSQNRRIEILLAPAGEAPPTAAAPR
ncbi:MAG: OmpA family protein [Anaeromyxobacteraceae bacterium]